MGGGGGDGGYEARQAAVEDKKADARRLLNAQFGEGTGTVDRAKYTSQRWIEPTYVPAGKTLAEVEAAPTYTRGYTGSFDTVAPSMQYGGEGDSTGVFADGGRYEGGRSEDVFDQAGYDADVARTGDIGATKAARERLYGTVRDNAYAAGKRGLDEGRERESRDLRFELFAKGLNGGSEDVNQNAMLGRTYDRGILDLGAKADAASANLRASDEQTRLNLLQGIDSGMDAGSVLSSAANSLANNGAAAVAEAQGTSIGDLFANAGLLNKQSEYRRGKAAGMDAYGSLFSRGDSPTVNVLGSTSTGRLSAS